MLGQNINAIAAFVLFMHAIVTIKTVVVNVVSWALQNATHDSCI